MAAAGRPGTIRADMVREGAVVIDVGVNRIPDPSRKSGMRLVGDADYDNLLNRASAITPVSTGAPNPPGWANATHQRITLLPMPSG